MHTYTTHTHTRDTHNKHAKHTPHTHNTHHTHTTHTHHTHTSHTHTHTSHTPHTHTHMCAGSGLWNLQYNSLLNLNYTNRTKAIAFADDLIIITRGKTVREAENIANIELSKISL